MANRRSNEIVVGQLGAAHGVRGWIRVASYTESPEDIFNYTPWRLIPAATLDTKDASLMTQPVEWRQQGKSLVVRLADINDRTAAEGLKGAQVSIDAACLPALEHGQYYWRDLIGLKVLVAGESTGTVQRLFETGANDVLVIRATDDGAREFEFLVPCTSEVIVDVNLDKGEMTIDWDLTADD